MQVAQAPLPTTSPELYLAGVAAVFFLALALATTTRRSTSPLAFDLGLMCVTMSSYNILEVAYSLTESPRWLWLEYAVASVAAIPTLRLFVGYVGQRRRWRGPLIVATTYFFAIAIACLSPWIVARWSAFPGGAAWALLMLAGMLPSFGGAAVLLWKHARRSNREERARIRLLAGALLLGVGGVATDLVVMAGGVAPRLSALGLVVAATLVALLMLRARAFEQVRVVTLVNAALAAALAVVAQLVVVTWVGQSLALLAVGTVVVTLALVAAVRPLYATLTEERARLEESATLGRFSQQMAHDVRNPLAAITGAAEFLLGELDEGRELAPQREFLELIVDRADRLERVIGDYQRMGRVEPQPEEIDVNEVAREALESHRVAGTGVEFDVALDDDLPRCQLDRDLFVVALENVMRNALEAMTGEGVLTLRTAFSPERRQIVVRVADDGPGMDPRTVERALDAFFTTKAGGSGLGLAFVAKVMKAHGGHVRVDSRVGVGTAVELEVPCPLIVDGSRTH